MKDLLAEQAEILMREVMEKARSKTLLSFLQDLIAKWKQDGSYDIADVIEQLGEVMLREHRNDPANSPNFDFVGSNLKFTADFLRSSKENSQ